MLPLLEKLTLSLAAGLLGFAAARVKWSIERERLLLEERRKKLRHWREYIQASFDQLPFHNTVVYSEIRPFLSIQAREAIESGAITIRMGRGGNVIKSLVLDDLAQLEKVWKLI